MINQVKKYISDNTGFLIRLDDIAENMNWNMMQKITDVLDKYKIKPVLGVIPNNSDPELLTYPKQNIDFWKQVREWKDKGWKIAMHGNNHVYDKFCSKTDYLGFGGNSEFCNHTYEEQFKKIKDGSEKFQSENIQINTFFAPNHTFDQNTLKALKKHGINEIVDGYGFVPYVEDGITFIPQLFYKTIALPFGIQSFQIHLNYFNDNDFKNFERFIESNSKNFLTYNQVISKSNNSLLWKILRMIMKKILQIYRMF